MACVLPVAVKAKLMLTAVHCLLTNLLTWRVPALIPVTWTKYVRTRQLINVDKKDAKLNVSKLKLVPSCRDCWRPRRSRGVRFGTTKRSKQTNNIDTADTSIVATFWNQTYRHPVDLKRRY